MKIAVVGGGRMGLPLACVLAKHGATVTVCDINPVLVAAVAAGESPYEEPGLPELIAELHRLHRLYATTDTAAAMSKSEAAIVIVPAHLTSERDIDVSILQAASAEIGKGLRPGTLVIYETTVSVGGTRRSLIPVLERHSGLKAGAGLSGRLQSGARQGELRARAPRNDSQGRGRPRRSLACEGRGVVR